MFLHDFQRNLIDCINIPIGWWKKSKNSKNNGKEGVDQDPNSSEDEEYPLISSIQPSDDSSDMNFEPTQSSLQSSKDQILAQFHQPKILSRVDQRDPRGHCNWCLNNQKLSHQEKEFIRVNTFCVQCNVHLHFEDCWQNHHWAIFNS